VCICTRCYEVGAHVIDVRQPNLSVNITKGQVGLFEEPGWRTVTFIVNKKTKLKTSPVG
jgi:hypothetical protein